MSAEEFVKNYLQHIACVFCKFLPYECKEKCKELWGEWLKNEANGKNA